MLVFDESAGRSDAKAIFVHEYATRAKRSEVKPYRRRSWSSVEAEHDRTGSCVLYAVSRVRGEEERSTLLALFFTEQQPARRRRVLELLTGHHHLVGCLDDTLFVMFRRLVWGVGLILNLRVVGLVVVGHGWGLLVQVGEDQP